MSRFNAYLITPALAVLFLAGCASPHVMDVRMANDNTLTCKQITDGIEEANGFEKKARDTRKVNGTNVAAAVLFWPALLGTYANSGDAIDAAKERRTNLTKLADEKGCK